MVEIIDSNLRRLGVFVLLSIIWTAEAHACMCAKPRTAAEISTVVEEYMSGADYVFAGVVVGTRTELRRGIVGPPGEQSEWTRYDIWVLEVGKGRLDGIVSVVRPNLVGSPAWLIGGYAEVIATEDDGELEADWGLCDCGRGHVFALNGPVPPWKAVFLYGVGLLGILTMVAAGIWIVRRRARRR